jgi:hypothetical protein
MDTAQFDRLVDGWISLQKSWHKSGENNPFFWAFEDVWELVADKPQDAFAFILAVLKRDDSMVVLANLSAGPLEDLLGAHGDLLIDQVEQEARRNPAFAFLLGGVWKNRIDDPVWERVLAIRDRRGWEGIPK